MRLNYKRGKLVGMALLFTALGAVLFLTALTPFESRRGIVRLLNTILSPTGLQVLVAATAVLVMAGGVRLLCLMRSGALAVQIVASGIRVRSIYYSGFLPWALVDSVESRVVAGWGNRPMLVIRRTERAGFLLWLVGQGDTVNVQHEFLDADAEQIASWIEATRNRERVSASIERTHPIQPEPRGFGRKRTGLL